MDAGLLKRGRNLRIQFCETGLCKGAQSYHGCIDDNKCFSCHYWSRTQLGLGSLDLIAQVVVIIAIRAVRFLTARLPTLPNVPPDCGWQEQRYQVPCYIIRWSLDANPFADSVRSLGTRSSFRAQLLPIVQLPPQWHDPCSYTDFIDSSQIQSQLKAISPLKARQHSPLLRLSL